MKILTLPIVIVLFSASLSFASEPKTVQQRRHSSSDISGHAKPEVSYLRDLSTALKSGHQKVQIAHQHHKERARAIEKLNPDPLMECHAHLDRIQSILATMPDNARGAWERQLLKRLDNKFDLAKVKAQHLLTYKVTDLKAQRIQLVQQVAQSKMRSQSDPMHRKGTTEKKV